MPDLTQFVTHWGYFALVVVVLLGNFGLPVPEETVLILAGYLVWEGPLRLVPTVLVGIVSAVVGDNLGYWLGRAYGRWPLERYGHWIFLTREDLDRMWQFLRRYGGIGVVVARFFPGLRFLGGPLAGAARLPVHRFMLANLLGAALFVPYAVGLGYAIGYGVGPLVERVQQIHHLVLLGVGIGLLSGAGHLIVRALRSRSKA
jgi:membrane protein DedA with SNARE-associated domain